MYWWWFSFQSILTARRPKGGATCQKNLIPSKGSLRDIVFLVVAALGARKGFSDNGAACIGDLTASLVEQCIHRKDKPILDAASKGRVGQQTERRKGRRSNMVGFI